MLHSALHLIMNNAYESWNQIALIILLCINNFEGRVRKRLLNAGKRITSVESDIKN
jgi:hypothetical protein